MRETKSYTAGHFELAIDGHPSTAYLKSVDGGFIRGGLMDEPIGPHNMRIKHISTVDIDPFSIDVGLSGAKAILHWIQSSWNKQYSRRNGQITHANFDLEQTFVHEFTESLITETTFPTLDGSSKEAGYLKLKIQPEGAITKHEKGGRIRSNLGAKQKMWLCSGFRLNIDHVDGVEYTNKIESFTITQGVNKFYTGADRFPTITPTNIKFPSLTGTIALGYAEALHKWHDSYVVHGKADPSMQKSGSIEFLAPNRSSVLFRLNLYEVAITAFSIVSAPANADQIKRAKFELYVGRMDLDANTGFE